MKFIDSNVLIYVADDTDVYCGIKAVNPFKK